MIVVPRMDSKGHGCKYGLLYILDNIRKAKKKKTRIDLYIFTKTNKTKKKHKKILVVVFRFVIRFWL